MNGKHERHEAEKLDLNGNCDFFRAVVKSDPAAINKYLDEGGDINVFDPYTLKTAIFIAADHDNVAMINYLIQRGADVNHRDSGGMNFVEYLEEFFD